MFVRSPSRPSPFPFSSVPVPFSPVPLSSVPFSSVPVPFSPAPALPPIYIRSPIGVAKRRSHPQTTTLRPIQSSPPPPVSLLSFPVPRPWRRQTETAPPNVYAQNPSAQPNGEDIAKRLRSESVNAAKRRSHPPNDYAQIYPLLSSPPVSPPLLPCSPPLAEPNGDGTTGCLRSEPLGAAIRRRHHRMPTLRTPWRSQTETAPPDAYAQNPST